MSEVNVALPIRWQLSVKIGKSLLWEWSPPSALKVSDKIITQPGNNSVSFSNDSAVLIIKFYGADFIYKNSSLQSTLKISPGEKIAIIHIVELWLGMNCRYVFSNMERWGKMTEKSYRNCFKKIFDWFEYNYTLVKQCGGKEIIAVFEPPILKRAANRLMA